MKNKTTGWFFLLLLPGFLLMSCSKNLTNYYGDEQDPGLTIFSNKGNNILTCFIGGKPWQTAPRVRFGLYASLHYEVDIYRQQTTASQDTLRIIWTGYYNENKDSTGYLALTVPIAKNFNYKSFSALQGQRINIDTTNGFFSTNIKGLNSSKIKGRGSIYFHSALLDSIGPSSYKGKMSGLIEADFISNKITKGRFDHSIDPPQIEL